MKKYAMTKTIVVAKKIGWEQIVVELLTVKESFQLSQMGLV